MQNLRTTVFHLERMLSPSVEPVSRAKVRVPDENDKSAPADFKRDLIGRAQAILESGKDALVGRPVVKLTDLGGDAFERTRELLADDADQGAFLRLANAMEAVVAAIRHRALTLPTVGRPFDA